jgi:hypothetical protein
VDDAVAAGAMIYACGWCCVSLGEVCERRDKTHERALWAAALTRDDESGPVGRDSCSASVDSCRKGAQLMRVVEWVRPISENGSPVRSKTHLLEFTGGWRDELAVHENWAELDVTRCYFALQTGGISRTGRIG